jgi:hypothetical protein
MNSTIASNGNGTIYILECAYSSGASTIGSLTVTITTTENNPMASLGSSPAGAASAGLFQVTNGSLTVKCGGSVCVWVGEEEKSVCILWCYIYVVKFHWVIPGNGCVWVGEEEKSVCIYVLGCVCCIFIVKCMFMYMFLYSCFVWWFAQVPNVVAQEQHEGFFSIISNGSIFVYNVTVKGSNTASLSNAQYNFITTITTNTSIYIIYLYEVK